MDVRAFVAKRTRHSCDAALAYHPAANLVRSTERVVARGPRRPVGERIGWLAKRIAARATTLRIGIVDRKTLLLDRVFKINGCPVKVRNTHLVDNNLNAIKVHNRIAIKLTLIEIELVDETGASARLPRDPQTQIVASFLSKEAAHLIGGGVGKPHAVGGIGGGGCGKGRVGHDSPRLATRDNGNLGLVIPGVLPRGCR